MHKAELAELPLEQKAKAVEILSELKRRKETNKLASYETYLFQQKFCNASQENSQKLLMAANRVGKSDVGAYEVAIHATGEYPEWWTGRRYDKPVTVVCGGKSNEQVKNVAQAKLVGDPSNPDDKGRGFVPLRKMGKATRKAGIPDALSAIQVKHSSGGWSKIVFISYDSGKEAWMGFSADMVWLDEEPPQDIYSQALRSIVDRGGFVSMTFTPENGVTEVVHQFTEDLRKGQFIMNATWDDAPHITEDVKEQILSALPPHEREMRSKGIPMLGSGMVYPIAEEALVVPAFDIPGHWPRIAGLDFGWDHPTAWVSVAWDRDSDTVYVYDVYSKANEIPAIHAMNIKHRGGSGIPTAWPHDGLITDKTSGVTLRQLYRDEGVNMLPEKFSNPPTPDGKSGGNGVEAGIHAIYQRMRLGTFKVFDHLEEWLREWRGYHRLDGKIVKKKDDLMDATRYAVMSVRYAQLIGHKYQVYNPFEHDAGYQDDLVAY